MGVWVNNNRYGSGGQRHYYEAVVHKEGEPTNKPHWQGVHIPFEDATVGFSLCGQRPMFSSGTRTDYPDKSHRGWKSGGLSSVESVNINQRNLCRRCVQAYVASDPELQAAYDLLRMGKRTK